jgi:predicted ester cyclase
VVVTELEKLIRRLVESVNTRDLEGIKSVIAPTYRSEGLLMDGMGPDAAVRTAAMFFTAFPDVEIVTETVVAQRDLVATRGYWTATHRGPFLGVNPTGRTVRVAFLDLWRAEDGKFIESWTQMDLVGLMQQLGAVSAHA